MTAFPVALLLASLAAGAAADGAHMPLAVPSGKEVWLQEHRQDRVPGIGVVERYRFVMPSLASLVPAAPTGDLLGDIPPEMLDEPVPRGDAPLSADDQADVSAALDELARDNALRDAGPQGGATNASGGDLSADGGTSDGGGTGDDAGLPRLELPDGSEAGDAATGMEPGPAPSDLAPPDSPTGTEAVAGTDAEAAGDLFASGDEGAIDMSVMDAGATGAAAMEGGIGDAGAPGGMALPAAPDALMQDPVHKDIVWLCEHIALPEIGNASPRPSQVVISLASAPSEFGTFDPDIVQLFEGFSLPRDHDACVWEPI